MNSMRKLLTNAFLKKFITYLDHYEICIFIDYVILLQFRSRSIHIVNKMK